MTSLHKSDVHPVDSSIGGSDWEPDISDRGCSQAHLRIESRLRNFYSVLVGDLEEKAIAALVEYGPDSEPFAGPVEYMRHRLELSKAEALELTGRLHNKKLIRITKASPKEPLRSIHAVIPQVQWERVPQKSA